MSQLLYYKDINIVRSFVYKNFGRTGCERASSRRIAGAPKVAALLWSLIWQGLGGRPQPRCSVAPGNLSKNRQTEFLPLCPALHGV